MYKKENLENSHVSQTNTSDRFPPENNYSLANITTSIALYPTKNSRDSVFFNE